MKKEQTLKDGSKAIFNVKDLKEEFLDDSEMGEKELNRREGQEVIILSLETATDLGDLDFEYYNIEFPDGMVDIGISGYHLEPID